MISIPPVGRVILAVKPIDFRKWAHTVAALVQEGVLEVPSR
jgi:hypothetical protein